MSQDDDDLRDGDLHLKFCLPSHPKGHLPRARLALVRRLIVARRPLFLEFLKTFAAAKQGLSRFLQSFHHVYAIVVSHGSPQLYPAVDDVLCDSDVEYAHVKALKVRFYRQSFYLSLVAQIIETFFETKRISIVLHEY